MLKKLSAILILIAMTAALAGCGNDKDSSSKNESSATTEAITEEITEEETETLTEAPAESEPTADESENSGSADTANTEESILGKWKSEYVPVSSPSEVEFTSTVLSSLNSISISRASAS